jgi:hypothetical protein
MCFGNSYSQFFNQPSSTREALEEQRFGLLQNKKVFWGLNLGLSISIGRNNISELRINSSAGVFKGIGWGNHMHLSSEVINFKLSVFVVV